MIKKLPNVIHHCPDEAFILLIQFSEYRAFSLCKIQ